MHIGVDATCWSLPRGFGRHTRCLLTALSRIDTVNTYTYFTDSPEATAPLAALAHVQLVQTSRPTLSGASANGRRSVSDLIAMSRALSEPSIDLLFFPTLFSYVPVFSRARQLMMIHDVTAERYPQLTLGSRSARWFWRAKAALARHQADAIATVSDYARQGLAQQFGLDASRLHVIGEAGDPVFRRLPVPEPTGPLLALGLTGTARLIVYVGGFSPHKNLPGLVEAFARLAMDEEFADVTLALVGDYEHETFLTCYADVRGRVHTLGLDQRVVFTGFLADEDLVALLNVATVLVLPSLMEGFGLPAIEAAACGCPVIATKESPIPQLLGDAGVYVDPRSPGDLDAALRAVLGSPERQAEMRRGGLTAAARLTWESAARELVRVMQTVGAG